jgi:hypothetical protein
VTAKMKEQTANPVLKMLKIAARRSRSLMPKTLASQNGVIRQNCGRRNLHDLLASSFSADASLLAQPFDPGVGELSGEAVPITVGVGYNPST